MKNNKRNAIIALCLVACLAVAGVSAYFTDADNATNEFTIGNISLDLQEPSWEPENAEDVTPNQTIDKDPQILNDGVNEEYVFITVEVPYANVVVAAEDGTKADAAADLELFTYEIDSANWVEVGTAEKDATTGTVTHVYAYAKEGVMSALAADDTTPALFTSVKMINLVEGQTGLTGAALDPSAQEIEINAYGIQTQNVNGGKTAPADVWEVVVNQNEIQ